MAARVDRLRDALFAATDGSTACDAINKLGKYCEKGDEQAKRVLAHYSTDGRINHMRTHACALLANSVKEPNAEFAALFQKGLHDPLLRYWSILGYMNAAGMTACPELLCLAEDASLPLEERGHAVKRLAAFGGQQFDRQLSSHPTHWKESDLRLSEVRAWAEAGYPKGEGYAPPIRHPAIDNPATEFERAVSRLDRKLLKQRKEIQNLAEPTNWLAISNPDDVERIKARWPLPRTYLDFLTRFSPIRVSLDSEEFSDPFSLFGAAELIEAQDGYSFNPLEQRPVEDWPAHLVVIASQGGDPFVLDLSQTDGDDAPVDTAEHGTGVWQWQRVANSFGQFLKRLATSRLRPAR